MTADLDHDLEARLARAGAHLDALAARDGAAGSPGSDAGGPGEVAYVRRSAGSPPPGRRLALAAAVVLLVAAVAGGLYLARPDGGPSGVATDPTPAPTTKTPPADGAVLEARPVLAAGPAAVKDRCAAPMVPSSDGATCFRLGDEVAFTDGDIATAEATLQQEWVVSITLGEGSRTRANAVFNACFAGGPTCPAVDAARGSLAIVVQGRVISAPSVSGENLADDAFSISGSLTDEAPSFTEADARALAAELQP